MEINKMKELFFDIYGEDKEEIRVFTSPGRVNLIGEHIDYCGGPVLPAALTMKTTVIARKRKDDIIRMRATDLDVCVETSISRIDELKGTLTWGDYQLGVVSELIKAGYSISGCDLLYDDTVPHGGGLSSSAAIEVSTALCFATFSNEISSQKKDINMIELALISQKAEHNFIGVNCGIMDQFASAMGKANHAVYLNCSTLDYEYVPLNLGDYRLVLSNSNVKHSLGSSKYNERRSECEEGLRDLKTCLPNIVRLSDVSVSEFEMYKGRIKNPIVQKRINHIVTECSRVHKSVQVLKKGDLVKFGELMNASHDSLRDDYEVSCKELDLLVSEARKIDGVLGSRMTGAGFGGCTVSVVKKDVVDTFVDKIGKKFFDSFGHEAAFYISEIGDGGREVKTY